MEEVNGGQRSKAERLNRRLRLKKTNLKRNLVIMEYKNYA